MTTWDEFERGITITGERYKNTAADCMLAGQEIGLRVLPPSYVDYALRFGAGWWVPDLMIRAPRHPVPQVRLRYNADFFKDDLNPKLQRLISFGSHRDGYQLCWDPDTVTAAGEMDICMVAHDPEGVFACGSTILEFLSEYWVSRKLDQVIPFSDGSWDCEPVFKALKIPETKAQS